MTGIEKLWFYSNISSISITMLQCIICSVPSNVIECRNQNSKKRWMRLKTTVAPAEPD